MIKDSNKLSDKQYLPIENHGIIGDLRTIALVGINGTIDFMCLPDFDSPSVFASLLDSKRGGFFQITPIEKEVKYKQMYLPDTNILLTRFLFRDGIGEITDFMALSELLKDNVLIRRVKSIKGEIAFKLVCKPRFNYGQSPHTAKLNEDKTEIIFASDALILRLKSSVPLHIRNNDGFAEFILKPDESIDFILENINEENLILKGSCQHLTDKVFDQTFTYWKNWTGQSNYKGLWREMVNRSALVLKLLISNNYGSIIAAPTFSLPELIGGDKNWDYRYTWIRDAAFTVYALMRLGYTSEAENFMNWIERLCKDMNCKGGALGLMYGIDGTQKLDEIIIKNFSGYKGSKPVRVGNLAYKQSQLDIYGELLDSIYLYDKYGSPISHDFWEKIIQQLNWLADNWKKKDHGIWESRGKQRDFSYSKIMCWVAFDRGIRLANKRSFPFPQQWLSIRNEIYNFIYENFWNEKEQSFVQFKGSDKVDASSLLMPLIRFISPKDPRWLSTLKRIEKELVVDTLVYRYSPEDASEFGLSQPGEGTFSLCSFWFTECLSRSGQVQKARFYFEKMLSYSNHLGLFSEQLGLQGEYLGNFPQAFTHLALISAAYDISRRLEKRERK